MPREQLKYVDFTTLSDEEWDIAAGKIETSEIPESDDPSDLGYWMHKAKTDPSEVVVQRYEQYLYGSDAITLDYMFSVIDPSMVDIE